MGAKIEAVQISNTCSYVLVGRNVKTTCPTHIHKTTCLNSHVGRNVKTTCPTYIHKTTCWNSHVGESWRHFCSSSNDDDNQSAVNKSPHLEAKLKKMRLRRRSSISPMRRVMEMLPDEKEENHLVVPERKESGHPRLDVHGSQESE